MESDTLVIALISTTTIALALLSVKLGLVTIPKKNTKPNIAYWILISIPLTMMIIIYLGKLLSCTV